MVNGKTKSPTKGFTIFYIIASVLVIITLAGLLIWCQTKVKEDLCLCFGSQKPGTERCVDPATIQQAYYSGKFLPQFSGV